MDLTLAQLRAIAPHAPEEALQPLVAAMAEAQIITPLRAAAFLAQVAHESNQFRQLVEDGDGWRYEGRHDLGNTVQGDGPLFRGRGYIQLTGRKNYTRAGGALGLDLVAHPELAARPDVAARVAAWYWTTHGCNALADDGQFESITRAINGGLNGAAQRQAYYETALVALGAVQACAAP